MEEKKEKMSKKFDSMTVGGINYLRGRIQIWALALILTIPLCLTSVISTVRIGMAEARSNYSAEVDTTDMSDREIHEMESSAQKSMNKAVWDESWFIFKVPNTVLGAILKVSSWGWNIDTCVDMISWLLWLVISVVAAVWMLIKYLMLSDALKQKKGLGKVETKVVIGYNLPFTGRALLSTAIIACTHAIVSLGAPVWFTYLAALFVLHFEKRAFLDNGGKLYETKPPSRLEELFSDLHFGQKVSNGLAGTYGYRAGKRPNKSKSRPLPDYNDYGD